MCKCTPSIRAPFCGKDNCTWPEVKTEIRAKSRRFFLVRYEDVSGLSGEGKVAEGVEFVSGMIALNWYGSHQCVNIYTSLRTVVELHGHQGRTVVEWIDDH